MGFASHHLIWPSSDIVIIYSCSIALLIIYFLSSDTLLMTHVQQGIEEQKIGVYTLR